MPNHVYQVLKFSYHGDDKNKINEIKSFIGNESMLIDFNKITPQPSGIQDDDDELVLSDSEKDFNIQNWGTKWNAYDISLIFEDTWKFGIRFCTDWGVPNPIINKIFEKFKDCSIDYVAADDGKWFAVHKQLNEDGIKEVEFNSDNNNDSDFFIRNAIFEALCNSY